MLVYLISQQPENWHFSNVAVLLTIYLLDGIDGYIAHKPGEASNQIIGDIIFKGMLEEDFGYIIKHMDM